MSQPLQGTPYTPIFPPAIPVSGVASSSKLSNESFGESDDDRMKLISKPYIDRLRERYLLLSSLPQTLGTTSYELDADEQARIDAWVVWIRERRENRLPLDLPLTCIGVRGGDWVGESNDDIRDDEYILPITEKEWFNWERERQLARQEQQRQQLEQERRTKIAQWTEQVQNGSEITGKLSQQDQMSLIGSLIGDEFSSASIPDGVRSRYFPPIPTFHGELARVSLEPVDRMTSPPPAPMLDPLLDFNESLSGNSAPSLPHIFALEDMPLPPRSPSFTPRGRDISTPRRAFQQLSSPISPPRNIKQLAPSQPSSRPPSHPPSHPPSSSPLPSHPPSSSLPSHPPSSILPSHPSSQKRAREMSSSQYTSQAQEISIDPTTPRASKRAKNVEPITPQSVERPSSQSLRSSQRMTHLPTLTELLKSRGSSRRGTPTRRRSDIFTPPRLSPTPQSAQQRLAAEDGPHFSPSQPVPYAMFRPQFESTQCRASSLPPSPHAAIESSLPDPFKALSAGSSSIDFYQSQFNVENNIEEVAAFLNVDVFGSDL